MFSALKKINLIFPKNIFYGIIFLYFCLIILTLFEFVGIGSIPILISMMVEKETDLNLFGFSIMDFVNKNSFFDNSILMMGLLIISIFFLKAIFLIIFNIFELSLRKKMKLIISQKLVMSYLKKPFTFFINNNTSKLAKNVITEVDQSVTYITSLINISRELSIVTALFLVMVYFEPLLAICVFFIITALVAIFLYSTDKKLKTIAKKRWNFYGDVFKSVGNIFGGIKDIKVFKRDTLFVEKFLNSKRDYEETMQFSEFIRRLPKIILEVFAIFFLVGLTMVFIQLQKNPIDLIPLLSIIAVAVIRFIPSFNTIAAETTYIKIYKLSFENVFKEIFEETVKKEKKNSKILTQNSNNAVEIKNLSFDYKDKEKTIPSIKNLNVHIEKNTLTGIMGKSGAGKSTLINIILGLLSPKSGEIAIKSAEKNISTDFKKISYVPQDIFLSDDTLKNNIAFGCKEIEIDNERVNECIKEAGLLNFLSKNKKEGLDMKIGEKGIKISGGERQRVGIARALYVQPEILILDEATSSLDNETERQVMKTILGLKKKCTIIIIAHRLSSIIECDNIYLLDKGTVIDNGKLNDLLERHKNLN
tara:strand:- start:128 stop:1897 length:1770 start_codon:yes stop_codon:yes gene_type:complete